MNNLFKSLLLIGILLFVPPFLPAQGKKGQETEVKLGVLLLSDADSFSTSESCRVLLRMAEKDVNEYAEKSGMKQRFRILEENVASPDEAVKAVERLAAKGVTFVVGPANSGELTAIKHMTLERNVIFVSQASTSVTLAIPDDGIFRLVPNNRSQADAILKYCENKRFKVILPICRTSVYSEDLLNELRSCSSGMGNRVRIEEPVTYPGSMSDFSSLLLAVKNKIAKLSEHNSLDDIIILTVSYDEVSIMMEQAHAYPLLAAVSWFGPDSVALCSCVVRSSLASAFAEKVNFTCSAFGVERNVYNEAFFKRAEAILKRTPEADAVIAYDIVWIIARMYESKGASLGDYSSLKNAFGETAETYSGISGWTKLDENGDRKYSFYDFWSIRKLAKGTYEWYCSGHYKGADANKRSFLMFYQ